MDLGAFIRIDFVDCPARWVRPLSIIETTLPSGPFGEWEEGLRQPQQDLHQQR